MSLGRFGLRFAANLGRCDWRLRMETSFAQWMCVVIGVLSLTSCIVVNWNMKKERHEKTVVSSIEQHSDQATISKAVRAFALATTPKVPTGRQRWILPFSFNLACVEIKAQYFAPFGFTAFSNEIYREKFGQSMAYISIRFIVGVSRSGIGYGIYGVVGNLIATLVPIIGGVLIESDSNSGTERVLWYFCGLMGMGALCWVLVWLLEGPRSLLELPSDQSIETSDEDLKLAALSYVVSAVKLEGSSAVPEEEHTETNNHGSEARDVEGTIEFPIMVENTSTSASI